MKYIYKVLLFCLVSMQVVNADYANAQNNVTRLANGLRVLIIEDNRAPLVSVRLYVEAGGSYEKPEQAGISHVLEHIVFRGTKKYPDGSLANVIESAGGDFNAYTSADETVYYCNLPASEWKKGIDVVADMALYPVIDEKILEEEKQVIFAEMGQRREEPEMRIYENTIALALSGTSYQHGVLGTEETVAAISVEDIQNYLKTFYNPQNMLLVVVGDIDKNEVLKEAQNYFGARENKGISKMPSAVNLAILEEASLQVDEGTGSNVLINIAFPAPSSLEDASRNLDIFGLMFGGLETSLLRKKFELDEKIVNSISSYNIGYKFVSLFVVSVDLKVENVDRFWKEFVELLANLEQEDFESNQLDTAKFLYETSFQYRKATIEGHASLVGSAEFENPGEFSLENYLNSIENLSLDSIFEEVNTWINPNNIAISILAPKSVIAENKLPNFLSILEKEWQVEASSKLSKGEITKEELQKLLPKQAKILEMNEKRIVLEYAKGSKVVLIPDNVMPFFAAELTFAGGRNLLSAKQQGLSSFLANTLTEATKTMSKEEFSKYLTQKAISISATSSRENFSIMLDAPTEFEGEAFKQFAEILKNPAFAKEDFNRIKEDAFVALRDYEERPDTRLFSELSPTLFTGNAYGYKTIGTKAFLEDVSVNDVKKLWNRQKEQAWVFTIAGDFDIAQVLDFVNTLPLNKEAFSPISEAKFNEEKQNIIQMPKANHDYILQLFPTVAYTHEDAAALRVLHGVLGDMSGILFQEIREKQGLAYSTAPIAQFLPTTGFLGFYVNTAPENREKILPAFEQIITDLKAEPLPEEILDRAKRGMQTSYISASQSLESRVSEAANNTYLDRSYEFQQEFIDEAKAVTPQDVQKVAQKYLNTENAYLLWVQSANEVNN